MKRLPRILLLQWTVCVVVGAVHVEAQSPRFFHAAEFGISNLAGTRFEKLGKQWLRELADAKDPKTKPYRDSLLAQKACLPLRVSVFTSPPWPRNRSAVAVVIDSAAAVDLLPLKRVLGDSLKPIHGMANGWRDASGVFLNQIQLAKDKHRLVALFRLEADPVRCEIFHGRVLPKPRTRRARQLQKLRTAPFYALGDIIRMARALGSKGDNLRGTPSRYRKSLGVEVGVALREVGGRPVLELSSSLPTVTGFFLGKPRDLPESCRVIGKPPPKPDLVALADFGRQGPLHGLAWLQFLEMVQPDRDLSTALENFLACWNGSASLYAQVDDGLLRGGIALELDEDRAERVPVHVRELRVALAKRFAVAKPDAAESKRPFVKLRLDWTNIAAGVEDGVAVVGFGPSEEFAVAMLRLILQGKGPKVAMPAALRPSEAPVAAWCRHGFAVGYVRQFLDRHRSMEDTQIAPRHRFGYRVLTTFGRLMLEHVDPKGMTGTMRWSNQRLQVRLTF